MTRSRTTLPHNRLAHRLPEWLESFYDLLFSTNHDRTIDMAGPGIAFGEVNDFGLAVLGDATPNRLPKKQGCSHHLFGVVAQGHGRPQLVTVPFAQVQGDVMNL